MTTSIRPSRVQLNVCGRVFSVAYVYIDGRWEASCGKLDIAVEGSSAEHVLYNMQKALEYIVSSQGLASRVSTPGW